ncbi:MAG: H+/Na+-translocating ferredoxin:NAD+ oxidoreductase subunit [Tenuifilum sp.]|jgi:electron transport complex protein RnfE|uniref:electron transport complex subunit RsxE n=1 Tax=Tenuifilum sp. TaxID=2760880 RepID=UPI0024ABDDEC|nr:electron transport complex subunit E [Tenuifilum sp.]MDI3527907.1 H+/Na+-translocating ferredoxin:NAD+ oxidoreductase subunit [Tenuifilum sp.]
MSRIAQLTKGILKENPIFVLVLGMCPTLATTSSAFNGMGMGLATTFVLLSSNIVISAIAGFIPDKVRIPSYIVVIATFVTIVDLVMQAYAPGLYANLGIFIPLIVVNCIVLGRAEAFANKNTVFDSMLDGLGMGIGFTFALTLLGSVREILGNFSVFGLQLIPKDPSWGEQVFFRSPVLVFILAPGAFIALAYLIAIFNKFKK